MNATQAGVDVAKSVFEVALSDTPGQVREHHRLSRGRFQRFFAGREPTEVLMEACGSAHYWGRELQELGHSVTLLPASYVARYRGGSKTDRADAKAILEASRNEEICPVPVKSAAQQAITTLHRIREGYIRTRTARINAVRGHLAEFGVVFPQGARGFVPKVRAVLDAQVVAEPLASALEALLQEIEDLDDRADGIAKQLSHQVQHMPEAALLMTVPGVGILTATAIVGFIGDIHRFRSGREFAAFLGLTPREHSSGNIRRLGSITKRGNRYVRMLLIHGARSALHAGRRTDTPDDLRAWALDLQRRKGHNVAAVALANKLARVSWRVLKDQRPFETRQPIV